jgi:hypothetical protein
VKSLHAKIGKLALENDFLEGALSKAGAAERKAMIDHEHDLPITKQAEEGMDHRDGDDRRKVRDWMKQEFNGEMVEIAGKMQVVGRTTKGSAVLNPFVERVTDWLVENYSPPVEALDPEKYKHWRDVIFPNGCPGYLLEIDHGLFGVEILDKAAQGAQSQCHRLFFFPSALCSSKHRRCPDNLILMALADPSATHDLPF